MKKVIIDLENKSELTEERKNEIDHNLFEACLRKCENGSECARDYEELCNYYLTLKDIEDVNKAIKALRRAAELGSGEGYFALGLKYEEGIGLDKDLEKSFRLLS